MYSHLKIVVIRVPLGFQQKNRLHLDVYQTLSAVAIEVIATQSEVRYSYSHTHTHFQYVNLVLSFLLIYRLWWLLTTISEN